MTSSRSTHGSPCRHFSRGDLLILSTPRKPLKTTTDVRRTPGCRQSRWRGPLQAFYHNFRANSCMNMNLSNNNYHGINQSNRKRATRELYSFRCRRSAHMQQFRILNIVWRKMVPLDQHSCKFNFSIKIGSLDCAVSVVTPTIVDFSWRLGMKRLQCMKQNSMTLPCNFW